MSDGEIKNDKRFRQKILFSGLRYKNGSPTDTDLNLEFDGRLFIHGEFKKRNEEFTTGQRIFFERLVDKNKSPSVVFIAEHDVPNNKDIIAANCQVTKWYYNKNDGDWIDIEYFITVKEFIDKVLIKHEMKSYIMKEENNNRNGLFE